MNNLNNFLEQSNANNINSYGNWRDNHEYLLCEFSGGGFVKDFTITRDKNYICVKFPANIYFIENTTASSDLIQKLDSIIEELTRQNKILRDQRNYQIKQNTDSAEQYARLVAHEDEALKSCGGGES